jgi:hypothetical protein
MRMLFKLVLISGVAMATAVFPAMAQQGQQQVPMGQGGMMGQGSPGMMNQGMMGQGMMNMMGPGSCSMMGGMGQGMMGMQGMMNPAMMGMMMGGPAAQGRLAYIKAELGLTDAQTAAWDAYVSAVNARVTAMQGMHTDMMQAMMTGSAIDRLDAQTKAMQGMLDSTQALKPATNALYAVLTDAQRQKADLLLVSGCMM